MYTLINMCTMLFVTMGPIKVLTVYAEKTQHVEGGVPGVSRSRRWAWPR